MKKELIIKEPICGEQIKVINNVGFNIVGIITTTKHTTIDRPEAIELIKFLTEAYNVEASELI